MSLCCVGLGAELGYVWECPDLGRGFMLTWLFYLFIYLFLHLQHMVFLSDLQSKY